MWSHVQIKWSQIFIESFNVGRGQFIKSFNVVPKKAMSAVRGVYESGSLQLVLPAKRQQGITMSNDANVTKSKTEKLKIAHDLQKLGMPSKIAAKLSGLPQGKVSS